MSAPLFRLLWRRHRLSIGLAALIPILLGIVIGFIYPTFSQQRAIAKALGSFMKWGGQGRIDLLSARGAFTLTFQHPLVLATIAVIAAIPATALPAGERGRGALDLLCATPLTRRKVVGTVAAFASCAALAVGLTGLLGAAVGATMAGVTAEVPWGAYAVVAGNAMALAACFGAAALLISALAPDRGAAGLWFGVAAFLSFLVDVAARLWTAGDWLGWFTPYGFLRPAATVAVDGSLLGGLGDAGMLLVGTIAFVLVALGVADRRTSV